MPVIGQYQISDIARVSYILHERWGRIVRLGGLLGRPDLLFVYDADEIEKVCITIPESVISSTMRSFVILWSVQVLQSPLRKYEVWLTYICICNPI